MADNTVLDAGAGGDAIATASLTFSGDTAKVQCIGEGILSGSEGSWTYTLLVGGAGAVTGGVQRVTLASDDPAVTSLAVIDDWDESDRAKVNIIAGQAGVDGNSGSKSAATVRVVIATDQPALTNKLLVTPDLPSGASTAAKQPALGTAGTASADVITVQGIASMTALKVDGSGVSQPVTGTFWQATQPVSIASVPSHDVTNGGTFVVQINGAALTALQLIDDVVYAEDTAHSTGDKGIQILAVRRDTAASSTATDGEYATLNTDSTGRLWCNVGNTVTVGTHDVGTVSTVTSLTQFNGTTIATNSGSKDAGTLRVVLATDQPALTNKLLVTPDLPSGASTAAKQPALGTAGTASSDVITVQGIASMTPLLATCTFASAQAVTQSGTWDIATVTTVSTVTAVTTVSTVSTVTNLSQMGGAAISMGTGVRGTGTQRVTICTDDVVPASQSGTWTVQPGNTANTTPWLVTDTPAISGGLSKFHLVAAATDNATNVKASAGQVYSITAFNLNASARYLKFHNTAGTPTAGSGVTDTFMIPGNTAGAGLVLNIDKGIEFSTGIGISIVTGIADSNTTAVAASEIVVNIYYK